MTDCQINDLSSLNLSSLTGLQQLSITDTRISDISPLSELSETRTLASLTLAQSQIRDITPLAKLNMLSNLYLSGNHISNIGPLSILSKLGYLFLEDNDIVDLAPLLEMDVSQSSFQRTYVEGNEYSVKMERVSREPHITWTFLKRGANMKITQVILILFTFSLITLVACNEPTSNFTRPPWTNVGVYNNENSHIYVNSGQEFAISYQVSGNLFPIITETHNNDMIVLVTDIATSNEKRNDPPNYSRIEWFLFKGTNVGDTQVTVKYQDHVTGSLIDQRIFNITIK